MILWSTVDVYITSFPNLQQFGPPEMPSTVIVYVGDPVVQTCTKFAKMSLKNLDFFEHFP